MSKRQLIRCLIAGEPVERCGFWLGHPHADSWPNIHRYFKTESEKGLSTLLNDDVAWICPQFYPDAYRDPTGRKIFDDGLDREIHGQNNPLASCETVDEVNAYPWPNPDYLSIESCLRDLENAGDRYRLSGFWTCFFHNVADLFGMEEYFVKMYTHPEVVRAATDRVCEFYYEANERFFKASSGLVDGYFFGNDFGTQLNLICSPEQFDQFILPWFKRFTDQGHRYGLQVVLHSCGAIHPVIERLIESGVNCLHPIQALAANMDAETLSKDFKGRITFMGGIDTQELLPNATPEAVAAEVRRVKALLGPNLIVSPSHEAILANVPPENIEAMATAAQGGGILN